MNIQKTTLSFFLLLSLNTFAQDPTWTLKKETKNAYLDSIKSTFVQDNIASCVDSLWMKELSNLDLYNDISVDIKNINIDQKVDFELPTELLKSRLAKMDAKSPFNIEYNQGLENIIKSFLKNRKKSFERLMAISEFYFPMFEEAMARQNVPLEIKYLAVVESALNPKAVSRVGATGLWQFMFQTGKQYGLDINTYVDDRSDPLKASDAAALYMSNMYKIFGDWDLVLASYNSGPGNVAKAIRRSGGQQNFWNIRKHLPKETQGYVPAFLATMYIYEYHKEHGIVPNRAAIKHFATDTIMVKREITFKQISDLIDIPVSQLQLLNPGYKRDVVPYISGENHYLRMPNDKVAIYTSNEDKIYAYVNHETSKRERPYESRYASKTNEAEDGHTITKTKFYKIKRGDSLSEIANEKASKLEKETPAAASKTPEFYVVQKGDNLSAIAKKYAVSVDDLKKWNNLSNGNIALGLKLKLATENENETINSDTEVASKTEYKTQEYVVLKGDNLGNIAKKYKVSADDLKLWNNLTDNNIQLGSTLIVAKTEIVVVDKPSKTEKASSKNKAIEEHYFVQKGDSLYKIAKKYSVSIDELKKLNGISNENLKPGMKLKISG